MAVKTVAEVLARFAHGLKFDVLPKAVVHEAKRRIIDSVGCALGAYSEHPAVVARSLAMESTGSKPRGARSWVRTIKPHRRWPPLRMVR